MAISEYGRAVNSQELHPFLTSDIVQRLLRLHPNEIATENVVPSPWFEEWYDWSEDTPNGWLHLVELYISGHLHGLSATIPTPLQELIISIQRLSIPRNPAVFSRPLPSFKEVGLSPKKAHEVSRMTAYILETIYVNEWDTSKLRIVDVGAGQGYLTRRLKAALPGTHILALDADEGQTTGAQRWERRLLPPPSAGAPAITHKTIHITPVALHDTVDQWILEGKEDEDEIPVLLIGLHACGSLTLDIIRAFSRKNTRQTCWKFAGVVAVGCCYNLMRNGEFPLSKELKSYSPTIDLPISAYHLAAQIPLQWLSQVSPPTPTPSVELALRKITWRALLGKKLQYMQLDMGDDHPNESQTQPQLNINLTPGRQMPWSRLPESKIADSDLASGTGATTQMKRLGRLRDTVYNDWNIFLDVAGKKMGVDFGNSSIENGINEHEKVNTSERDNDVGLERYLEVIHTLRCLIGPVVESTILLDRLKWIEESMNENRVSFSVDLVNLFDQATGSGRNVAIVIAPRIPALGT